MSTETIQPKRSHDLVTSGRAEKLEGSPPGTENQTIEQWQPGDPIGYIQKEAPEFCLPAYAGQRYESFVPDTLDLADRARLGLNVLTQTLDPAADYELYFGVIFGTNPPVMSHDFSDLCDIKFLESMPLMRIISGSDLGQDAEKGRIAARLRMVGEDGRVWEPTKGRPWAEIGVEAMTRRSHSSLGDQLFTPIMTARFLGMVSLHHLLTQDAFWCGVGERVVDALNGIVIRRDDYAYTPLWLYGPDTTTECDTPLPTGQDSSKEGWIIQGLTQFYRTARYEPAIDLAGRLARYCRHHGEYFGPEGEFISTHTHTHSHTLVLLAIADYAITVGDKELLEFSRKGYEYGRTLGNPLIGYFPEWYDRPTSTCETCEVADMIALGVKLSLAGAGDYWDDVDRYLRNHFAEAQLTDPQWIYRYTENLKPAPVHPWSTADRVPERNVGAFAGWASANEWWAGHVTTSEDARFVNWTPRTMGIMHCCTGNATRAIYYAWESILHYSEGELRVNLLLNRASQWADVHSYIPYEGRVDVQLKQKCDLSVRIPQWSSPEQVSCTVQGKSRPVTFDDRYAQVGPVTAGETATLRFPIWEQACTTKVAANTYRVIRRGNEVVEIDPAGKVGPLYQRSHYRNDEARWRRVERFVSDRVFRW